jgi:EAL domain-containing protein (putative c-di-GMP-specific phosphodiesterase class I)
MTGTAARLREPLSQRSIYVLGLLDRLVSVDGATSRSSGTLFDLERVAALIDSDQPEIVFHRIVELATGRVLGHEALSRFRIEPVRSPDIWFAQAARVGLGIELELKAVRSALALLGEVSASTFLSLNVSAATLCSRMLADALHEVDPGRIVLELTEHDFVEDYPRLAAALRVFRNEGFRVAVDDAGAGCAGFSHILKVNPDYIKVDRAIVRSIDRHPGRQDLVMAIVALARGIGATVVAEGVETEAELETLLSIGVADGQGNLFGRPGQPPFAPISEPHLRRVP